MSKETTTPKMVPCPIVGEVCNHPEAVDCDSCERFQRHRKAEPFCPPGGDDVLDFVMRRVGELTKDEIKEREKKGISTVLHHLDVYAAYIADGLTRGYAYIPPNDHFRWAMAYAMAKAYGCVEERDPNCDLFMNGYKGFSLCEG